MENKEKFKKNKCLSFLIAIVMIFIYAKYNMVTAKEVNNNVLQLKKAENVKKEIPEDAFKYNAHHYKVFDESVTWYIAKEKCEAMGGHLVTITDNDEQKFIESILQTNGVKQYFIGAKREENSKIWRWVTGEKWKYSHWRRDQPDNKGGIQTCVRIVYAPQYEWKWEWDDIDVKSDSEYKNGYICEWDDILQLGDVNGDWEVNTKDAVLLKKYLAGFEGIEFNHDAADVNADGVIDSKDAVRLLRHLAGYDVTLGK